MQPVILLSARRHGIADEDVLHALRNATDAFTDQGQYGLTIYVGPDREGVALEVGVDDATEPLVIVHAMRARKRYLR